jgi:hypothetical protein
MDRTERFFIGMAATGFVFLCIGFAMWMLGG